MTDTARICRRKLEGMGLVIIDYVNDAFLVKNQYGRKNWVEAYKVVLDMIPDYVFTERN